MKGAYRVWIVELNHRINKVKGNHFDFIELHTDHAEEIISLLKEQEAEIRQLRLALDIAKGTCNGIVMKGQ